MTFGRATHPEESERDRTLDLVHRLRAIAPAALATLLLGCLLAVQTYGVIVLPPVALAVAALLGAGYVLPRSPRPGQVLWGVLAFCQLMIVAFIAAAPRFQLDNLGLMILPVVAGSLLLPTRRFVAFLLFSSVAMVVSAFAIDPDQLRAVPPILILPLGAMWTVAVPGAAVRRLEGASRATAVADSLTGALNRMALEARIRELGGQSADGGLPLGVLICDIDHFKSVNDELGHDAGDEVLREVVRRMRTVLEAFTPLYRFGGEEFVVLVPGAQANQLRELAETLRVTVSRDPIGERTVTMSFGVASGSLDDQPFELLLEAADEALYSAKATGRDRVAVAGEHAESGLINGPEAMAAAAELDPAAVVTDAAVDGPARRTALASKTDERGNWLIGGDLERDHLRALSSRLNHTHYAALGCVFTALLLSIPWIGWELMIPAACAIPFYHLAERHLYSWRRPEYAIGASWLGVQIGILGGAIIVAKPAPYLLVLFIPMLIGITSVFPARAMFFAVGSTVVLIMAAGQIARPELFQSYPGLITAPVVVAIGMGLLGRAAGASSIDHRAQAVVDPLTGLLNRAALQARVAELRHQSRVTHAGVAVIAVDLDGFKGINDTRGHGVGDDVIRGIGETLRGELSGVEWAFRFGGDEFVVLLVDGAPEAAALAERLRTQIELLQVGDAQVTGSFGVAASDADELFDFDAVLRRADEALYAAKRDGRNRVQVAGESAERKPPLNPVA